MNELENVKTYSADLSLRTALDIGENILKNGGEIHRVEDTIERICKYFGAEEVDVFCITSLIVASVRMKDGEYSNQIRRISRTSNNLYVLEEMNNISRKICKGELTPEEAKTKIENIKNHKVYNIIFYYIATIFASGCFAIFFGGDIWDGIAAAIVGLLLTAMDRIMPKSFNPLVVTVINSIIGGSFSIIMFKYIGIGSNLDMIMIGTIMLLIPGLALGNAIRDMLGGDIVSGSLRMIQCILTALMIAFGYAAAITIFGKADISTNSPGIVDYALLEVLIISVTGMLSSLGFGVLFNVKPNRLHWILVGALLSSAVYGIFSNIDTFWVNVLSAFAVTMFSEIISRIVKAPVIVFLTPGIIPLVPGGALYRTVSNILFNNEELAFFYGKETILICLGIAGGVMSASLIMKGIRSMTNSIKDKKKLQKS